MKEPFVPATEEEVEKMLKRRGYSSESFQDDVRKLRDWLEKQPHLPHTAGEKLLQSFVFGSKTLERAKERLDGYYTCRGQLPELLRDRDPEDGRFREKNRITHMFVLPRLTADGVRVIMMRNLPLGPECFDHRESLKRTLMMTDVRLHEDPVASSHSYVMDLANTGPQLLLKVSPLYARQLIHYCQEVLPKKFAAIILFNANPLAEKIVNNLFKPFLKKKMQKRIHVYSEGHGCLKRHFPLSLLPRDYGGSEPTTQQLHDAWTEKLESYREWFLGEGNATSDESKRPDKSFKCKELDDLGLEGTFRKLEFD